jgi:hypothetical protein
VHFELHFGENIKIERDSKDEEADYILHFSKKDIKVQLVSCDHEIIPIQIKAQKNP